LNNEILANFLSVIQEGKKFQCKGYKTLLLDKKSTKVTTFFEERNSALWRQKRKYSAKRDFKKKRFIFGKLAPNSPHFEERNSEAAIFRQ
jgi:hypothetical protein